MRLDGQRVSVKSKLRVNIQAGTVYCSSRVPDFNYRDPVVFKDRLLYPVR